MNITALQTFLAIVDTGNLVRASQKLNVTQSTVTARLKSLEDELGQQLLNRQKSGTTLTPAGTKLLRYARIMTGLWRQARYETGLPAGLSSVCTFGCDRELWHGPGRAFFDGVVQGHPDMAVSVQQGGGRELEDWLAAGLVDVILTYGASARGNQTVYALPPEELVLYSDREVTSIRADPKYIFVDHGEEYRRAHGETYHDAGIARVSFDSSFWALQFLLERGGSAYLPRALAAPLVAEGRLFELREAPIYSRKKMLVVNDSAAANWDWFAPLVGALRARSADWLEHSDRRFVIPG
ncbi:MAG: LysR family transcriptional regulator [Roseovarius sp.]|uniref:LysR family transcriptional regulator n=1 Tax=Roseovarius sp. TaxID=1486281 RepID=UPI001B73708C|nr:LysR family transcriptional regulator [Roseovarius sp.]MBQ0750874.1 LysR family transcriptional regulator [Roseovarius sp.]MBQ0811055.1 LysR family transcriptional regulator [Roseovarius sp.]